MKVRIRGIASSGWGKIWRPTTRSIPHILYPEELFDYLQTRATSDDCSLADSVRLMAADAKVRASDIGVAWWQDADTPEMRARGEKNLSKLARLKS
jgi:hypothetical protein